MKNKFTMTKEELEKKFGKIKTLPLLSIKQGKIKICKTGIKFWEKIANYCLNRAINQIKKEAKNDS